MGRLSQSNCGAPSNVTFTFDPFGNICKNATSGTSFCPGYNTSNQIANGSYDNDGDLLTDPVAGSGNAFDAEGRPTTFINTAVVYDALGRAVEAGGQEFFYGPGGSKIAAMSGQSLLRAYVPLPGGAEAVFNGAGFAWFRHADMLGSGRLATTFNDTLASATAYAPFGEPLLEAGGAGYDRSYTGQKQDIAAGGAGTDANGQYDFLAREYSPTQARWWTPDPAGLDAVDPAQPQTWDRYAYIDGNPLAYLDPLGLDPFRPCFAHEFGTAPGRFAPTDDCQPNLECPWGGLFLNPIGTCSPGGGGPPGAGPTPGGQIGSKKPPQLKPSKPTCTLAPIAGKFDVGLHAHPLFQPALAFAITASFLFLDSQGITPGLTSGFRTPADQLRMRSGASGPNPAARRSWHEVGLAIDLNANAMGFAEAAQELESFGLMWGGNFVHRPDPPHFQLAPPGTSPSAQQIAACGVGS